MKIYLAGFLVISVCNISLGSDVPYCFQFTWLDKDASVNCSAYEDIPCKYPIEHGPKPPNISEIWDKAQKNENTLETELQYRCTLQSGSACIKYTYSYNNANVNITYFCGKVIEDQTSPITSGCYIQRTEGYTIEACACRSKVGSMPCNSTTRNTFSVLNIFVVVIISLFTHIYKIVNVSYTSMFYSFNMD